MKKKLIASLLLGSVFLNSCSSYIVTRLIRQDFLYESSNNDTKKKTLDAITYVLMSNGFEIDLVNESFGLVNTKWRQITNAGDFVGGIISSVLSDNGTYNTFEREFSIQIKLTDKGYELLPKMKSITKTNNRYGNTSTDTIIYPDSTSSEGKLAMKIVQEINNLLNIQNNYRWEEKTIISE